MALAIYKNDDQTSMIMQNNWARQLNPLLANPANQSIILKNQILVAGTNVINHKLGQKLQGWNIVRKRADASIYDTQDTNQTPQLTLLLVSNNPVVVDIEVF